MNDHTQIFSGHRADNYHNRPEWSEGFVRRVLDAARCDAVDFPEAPVVLDLGAGNGQLTRVLTALNERAKIYAVEPSDDMRVLAVDEFSENPNVEVSKGRADSTGLILEDPVDIIVAGQAAHWWSSDVITPDVLAELNRASHNNTRIAYLFYNLAFDEARGSYVAADIDSALNEHSEQYRNSRSPLSDAVAFRRDNFEKQIANLTQVNGDLKPLEMSQEKFFSWMLSYSFVSAADMKEGEPLRLSLEGVFNEHKNEYGQVIVPVYGQAYVGDLMRPTSDL